MSRANKPCLTPGAFYHFSIDDRHARFSVTLPASVRKRIGAGRVLQRALHDAAEAVLGPKWLTQAEIRKASDDLETAMKGPSMHLKMPKGTPQ